MKPALDVLDSASGPSARAIYALAIGNRTDYLNAIRKYLSGAPIGSDLGTACIVAVQGFSEITVLKHSSCLAIDWRISQNNTSCELP